MTSLSVDQSIITDDHLIVLHKLMLDSNDKENADKILDLYKKKNNNELLISFTGHFSAGKSSMINALLGMDILPKSPIPTSANIVKITSGEGVARVFFHHEAPFEYKEPYDINMIRDFCKDKDTIERIELSTSDNVIPSDCAIIDSPGIDAADDTDRVITESSMHLIDLLFYIMDYNHVQSEVNLQFLNKVQAMGIPYFIIINQVDKHNEKEISFQAFKDNIKQTFDQWAILPKGIYFSSLINSTTNHNQFTEIKKKLFTLFEDHQYKSILRIDRSTMQIIKEHKDYLQQATDEQMNNLALGENLSDNILPQLTSVNHHINKIHDKLNEIRSIFQIELEQTLKNAYLMPADLRDKAAIFLESQQPNFKVGFLGSKKKTEDEKTNRMNTFLISLQKHAEASILWRLRDKFIVLLKENEISDQEIMKEIQQITLNYPGLNLLKLIKPGAKFNGNYVLNYTDEVSRDLKNKYKQLFIPIIDKIKRLIGQQTREQLSDYKKKRTKLQNSFNKKQMYDSIQASLKGKFAALDAQLNDPIVTEAAKNIIENKIKAIPFVNPQMEHHGQLTIDHVKINEIDANKKGKAKDPEYTVEKTITLIEKSIQAIEELPSFQSIVKVLKEKQNRLEKRSITVALFGAFSAGKSSFANAIIGENTLPTSPNPTTAVINRILPITDVYHHGTVVIQLKDETTLANDLISVTKQFSPSSSDFMKLMEWIKEKQIYKSNELNKMYQAFLTAIIQGYDWSVNHIGKEIIVTFDDFREFVTDETRACYIESINLYYDCSLTQQGITLVDTPGADSINARHTNVAFDYIKHADVILYVTYYNHAFSRADKDFLMQLGRVKEAFELDKMFFIINAIDLAHNDSEITLVQNYLEEQLMQLGIRFPKIFPVSSKKALWEKENNQSLNKHMTDFEHDFYEFIKNDLASLMIDTSLFEIRRAQKSLANFIETVNLGEQEKHSYRQQLLANQERLEATVETMNLMLFEEWISQKVEKQLHYVEERLALRFHDFFKEKFNPTTITESGRKATIQLRICLRNLVDYTGYELLQEVRAVSLRLEGYIREMVININGEIGKKMNQIDDKFLIPSLNEIDLITPEYEQAFSDIDMQAFDRALARFKGTKSFFEKNEKEIIKEDIYNILVTAIQDYITNISQQMDSFYLSQWNDIMNKRKQDMINEINLYVDNSLSIMSDSIDTSILIEKYNFFTTIFSKSIEKDE